MPLLLSARASTSSPIDLFTAAEGRALGLALRTTDFIRVRHGVYARRVDYVSLSPWARYAARVHAFALAHPDSVLCLESAAVAHGLPLFGETREIHVQREAPAKSARYGDVRVHNSVHARTVVDIGTVRSTSFVDTVVDLVRVLPPAQALAVVDAALSHVQGGGAHALSDFTEACAARAGRRGAANAGWVWEHADGRSESPTESISRAVMLWSGFETPELQCEFRYEGQRDRVDFLFRSGAIVGEADGWSKYHLAKNTEAAALLTEEKRREDRLRRHGHPVARWESRDAWHVTPLRQKLLAAGVPQSRPASPAFLATLRHRTRRAL